MQTDAWNRGRYDAKHNKSPIFRKTVRGIIPTIDDDMADNWSEEAREAYIEGYDDYLEMCD